MKGQPWLSVVCPTVGRESLRDTLDSLCSQDRSSGVEVLVVADTYGGLTPELEQARTFVELAGLRWLEHDAGVHCYGQPQRTYGASRARAPYVWFTQDDNIAAASAYHAISTAIDLQDTPRPLFFRFVAPWREVIWRTPHLWLGNIDADCLVFPRAIARQVEWGLRYEGDFDAATQAFDLSHGDVAWWDRVVSIARPSPEHRWWQVSPEVVADAR